MVFDKDETVRAVLCALGRQFDLLGDGAMLVDSRVMENGKKLGELAVMGGHIDFTLRYEKAKVWIIPKTMEELNRYLADVKPKKASPLHFANSCKDIDIDRL
jgi:hypothetical protein